MPVNVRLLGGSAENLANDNQWNLDLRTRRAATLADIQRFHLLNSNDNQWHYEQAFAETLRHEGILAPPRICRSRFQWRQLGQLRTSKASATN